MIELRTARLRLRPWQAADREPFAALNADPEVMAYFPAVLDRATSDAFVDRIEAAMAADGFGLWAVEVAGGAPFIGFVGLARPNFEAPFLPGLEIGWRLARAAWGHGYAPEAGVEVLRFAFEEAGLAEVLSFTTETNRKSRRVMEKLGMTHHPDEDFDHPAVGDWWGKRHVLHRITREQWRRRERAGPR